MRRKGEDKGHILVIVTASSVKEGEQIARVLIKEGLAACCSIMPVVRSIYKWKGRVFDEKESMLFIKSRVSAFDKIKETVMDLHSYDVPEIIALPVLKGLERYLLWIDEVVRC